MRTIVTTALLVSMGTSVAWAGPTCTDADRSQWLDAAEFRKQLEAKGYEIKTFQVTDGNCYEIYGWNKRRQKVEIYFDPVTGKIVKARTG
jgi:hypothetical protein